MPVDPMKVVSECTNRSNQMMNDRQPSLTAFTYPSLHYLSRTNVFHCVAHSSCTIVLRFHSQSLTVSLTITKSSTRVSLLVSFRLTTSSSKSLS